MCHCVLQVTHKCYKISEFPVKVLNFLPWFQQNYKLIQTCMRHTWLCLQAKLAIVNTYFFGPGSLHVPPEVAFAMHHTYKLKIIVEFTSVPEKFAASFRFQNLTIIVKWFLHLKTSLVVLMKCRTKSTQCNISWVFL